MTSNVATSSGSTWSLRDIFVFLDYVEEDIGHLLLLDVQNVVSHELQRQVFKESNVV